MVIDRFDRSTRVLCVHYGQGALRKLVSIPEWNHIGHDPCSCPCRVELCTFYVIMTSTYDSSEMSLWKFEGKNFNYQKEQNLILRGQIDPIQNASTPTIIKPKEWNQLDQISRRGATCNDSDTSFLIVLLHGAVVRKCTSAQIDTPEHL